MSDASPAPACAWCRSLISGRRDAVYCSRKCRQAAFRTRRYRQLDASSGPGLRPGAMFGYADPPYPGMAHYYADQPTYGGEVDHAQLIASLVDDKRLTGWALSTSSKTLREVLPLCPEGARVTAWVKPIGVSGATRGLHSAWEPLIVVGGRLATPGVRDWVAAQPAKLGGSDLIGRKPLKFCAFLFDALGMVPGDVLLDLFPGSGVVGRAWENLSSRARGDSDVSLLERRDASVVAGRQLRFASLLQHGDASES